jgi:hypothetical protein
MKIVIVNGKFVNFKVIKACVKKYDHVLLCPPQHKTFWADINEIMTKKCLGVTINPVVVSGPNKLNLVEELGEQLALELLACDENIMGVMFEISEGPNQGVVIVQWKDKYLGFEVTKEGIQYAASV